MLEKKLEGAKWFEYSLMDAWLMPISCVDIMKDERNTVIYTTFTNPSPKDKEKKGRNAIHTLELDDKAMQAIMDVLSDEKIYQVEEFEKVICLDGFQHRFYFSDGINKIDLMGANLWACEKKPSEYPNANIVIAVLRKLEAILVPLGVDKQCFKLELD